MAFLLLLVNLQYVKGHHIVTVTESLIQTGQVVQENLGKEAKGSIWRVKEFSGFGDMGSAMFV